MKNNSKVIIAWVVVIVLLSGLIVIMAKSYVVRWIDYIIADDVDVNSHLFSEELMVFSSSISEYLPSGVELVMGRVNNDEKTVIIYFEYVDSLEKANNVINLVHEYLSHNSDCIIADYRTDIVMYIGKSYEDNICMRLDNYENGQGVWTASITADIVSSSEDISDGTIVNGVQFVAFSDCEVDDSQINRLRGIYPCAELEL